SSFFLSSCMMHTLFFFSSRRRHTISKRDWSSDVCSSDLLIVGAWAGSSHLNDHLSRDKPRKQRTLHQHHQGHRKSPGESPMTGQIGRASCSERAKRSVGDVD